MSKRLDQAYFSFALKKMNCRDCKGKCHKRGKRNGRQVYRCTLCYKSQRKDYLRQSYSDGDRKRVVALTVEGMGISSVSRLLGIPKSSVCRLLVVASNSIERPKLSARNEEYEIDELKTFIGHKKNECWICYAINRKTKQVVDYVVGKRTKRNIKTVTDSVLALSPSRVYTDGLNIYPSLIPAKLHCARRRLTNRIERKNLTLRTHLKRLARKTICYSRSPVMLTACLKIYFWYVGRVSFLEVSAGRLIENLSPPGSNPINPNEVEVAGY